MKSKQFNDELVENIFTIIILIILIFLIIIQIRKYTIFVIGCKMKNKKSGVYNLLFPQIDIINE